MSVVKTEISLIRLKEFKRCKNCQTLYRIGMRRLFALAHPVNRLQRAGGRATRHLVWRPDNDDNGLMSKIGKSWEIQT
jgi:hypothetical protein